MWDKDLDMIIIMSDMPETWFGPTTKQPTTENFIGSVFLGLSFNILLILLLHKYYDASLIEVIKPVIETTNISEPIRNSASIFNPIPNTNYKPDYKVLNDIFNNTCLELTQQNRVAILKISFAALEELEKTNVNVEELPEELRRIIINLIKKDNILYDKFFKNDLMVEFVGDLCYYGFANENLPELLGFEI